MSQSTPLLTLMFAALPALAFAESAPLPSPHPGSPAQSSQAATEQKPWSVTVGLGIIYGTLYEGSAERKLFPFPLIEATYYNWSLGFDGLRYHFIDTEKFVMGAGVGYDFGRKDSELPKNRRGLGDVKGGAAVNLFAQYYAFDVLGLSLEASQSYGDSDSLLITAGAESGFPLYGESLIGDIGISATWANDAHMRSYYGVSPQQSARSGLRRFTAESGIQSANFSAGVTYMISERWAWNLSGGVDILLGDAADSPVVEGDTQPFVSSMFTYTF